MQYSAAVAPQVRENGGRTWGVKILPQPHTVSCRGSLPREKKRDRVAHSPELGPPFERAQAKRAHLKVALLAERHARGRDGQRMRSPQHWHGARATRSVYGWLRSHVVEAAGTRSS